MDSEQSNSNKKFINYKQIKCWYLTDIYEDISDAQKCLIYVQTYFSTVTRNVGDEKSYFAS